MTTDRLPTLANASVIETPDGKRWRVSEVLTKRFRGVEAVYAQVRDVYGVTCLIQLAGPKPTGRVIEYRN